MNLSAGMIAIALAVGVWGLGGADLATAQDRAALTSDRDKVSYMVGMDVGQSLAAVGQDMDLAAFRRAVRNTFDGGKPLIAEEQVPTLGQALMQRIAARNGQDAAAGRVSESAWDDAARIRTGYLLGADVGRALAPIQDELDLKVLVQAVGDRLARRKPLLAEAEAQAMHPDFAQRMRARQLTLAEKNRAKSTAFLTHNKNLKAVSVTSSGLQYMVLRQGAGPRPTRGDQVRINYQGRLLDDSLYDSTYDRHQPVEFVLDPSVPGGWTEALSLMPVGGKYRFWMPVERAYVEGGTPGVPIGPNATLAFDVELMSIDH